MALTGPLVITCSCRTAALACLQTMSMPPPPAPLPQVLLLGGGIGAATMYAGCQLPDMHMHERQQGQQGQQVRALGGCSSSALHLWHFPPELHLPTAAGSGSEQEQEQASEQQQAPQAVVGYFSEAVQQLQEQVEVENVTNVGVVLLGALPHSGAEQQAQHGLLPSGELLQYMRQLARAARLAQRAFPRVSPALQLGCM
jgi:hypothetical protein